VLSLVFGYGAWTLKPWAWTLGIVAEGLSILYGLYSIVAQGNFGSIIGIIIAAVIIYYLFTPNVKQAFGRS
jgi:uncharacterized membrane protein (DUF2068 family)